MNSIDPELLKTEHPKDRPAEEQDPMLLQAEPVPGDPWVMLDALVEEFARLGWSEEEILNMFHQPFYQAAYGLMQFLGEDKVRSRIGEIAREFQGFQIRVEEAPEAPPPQLVQIDLGNPEKNPVP